MRSQHFEKIIEGFERNWLYRFKKTKHAIKDDDTKGELFTQIHRHIVKTIIIRLVNYIVELLLFFVFFFF